jgi:filamentous hemagglutinin
MAVTRIKNNQITDATVVANAKLVDYSISSAKLANNLTYQSNLTITGNLTVQGNSTAIDTTITTIEDPIIVLASTQTSGAPAVDIGFLGFRGNESNIAFVWDESADEFVTAFTSTGETNTTITITSYADFHTNNANIGGNLVLGGNLSITGNVANLNVTGNITGGNLLTPGLISATANITGGNVLTGGLISATANVTGGNVLTGGLISATANVTGGNILTGGLISATSTITSAANITGGNILTGGLISAGGNITSATNVNTPNVVGASGLTVSTGSGNINLSPTTGNIVINNTYINGVSQPVQDNDAASKIYVDNLVTTAISYHEAVVAATTSNLATATGGTITYAQPNGVSNGIGATLTTTGSFNLIDTANVQSANARILVKNEANAAHNGIYAWSNATVITRAADEDTYGPASANTLSINDYFYVTNGNVNVGSAWITDAPAGVITFGTSNILFAQFSSTQVYSANTSAGLSLIGTVFSAKVDNNTTAFDGGGNISVKASANLTTPNIGAATGTSLSVTGNINAGTTMIAGGNITGGNILTGGLISATSTITSAANITGGNLLTSGAGGAISGSGNITGGNILTGGVVSATSAGTFGNITVGVDSINSANSRITVNSTSADTDIAFNADTVANAFYIDAGTGTASFGSSTQVTNAIVNFDTTNSIKAPVGNTAQRPAVGVTGMIRFNTTNNAVEVYDNSAWTSVGVPVFTVIADEQFNGDGSTVAFTLATSQTTNSCIVSINGVVQIPTLAYSVSTTTLTFTEAPLSGDVIDVREITTTTTVISIANSSGNAVVATSETAANVNVTGNLVISGSVSAAGFIGLDATKIANGTSEMAVVSSGGNIRANIGGTTVMTISPGLVDIVGNLTVSGNATLSGNILGDRVQNGTTSLDIQTPNGNANITVGGTSNVAVFTTTGVNVTGNVVATANIAIGTGAGNLQIGTSTSNSIHFTNPASAGNITFLANVGGTITEVFKGLGAGGFSVIGNISTGNTITAGGNVSGANVIATTDIYTPEIVKTGSNAVGNIGQSSNYFNTVFAQATSALYADLAEKYVADADYPAGTVVAFGGSHEVTIASNDSDRRVAGVISTNPSYIMNGGLEAEHVATVALTGRVPTLVVGTVRKGDLMVVAGLGRARAEADPKVGTVIGKALEDFDGAEGTIEVVVGRF